MFIHLYKKKSIIIFLLNLISLLFTACNETRQFNITLFFEDYGLDIHSARLIRSEMINYNRKKIAVGEFYIPVEKWDVVVAKLKKEYCLINHFQKEDIIDDRNRNLLNITSEGYDIYPYQIYSSNVYFYVKQHDANMYIKCVIDFN